MLPPKPNAVANWLRCNHQRECYLLHHHYRNHYGRQPSSAALVAKHIQKTLWLPAQTTLTTSAQPNVFRSWLSHRCTQYHDTHHSVHSVILAATRFVGAKSSFRLGMQGTKYFAKCVQRQAVNRTTCSSWDPSESFAHFQLSTKPSPPPSPSGSPLPFTQSIWLLAQLNKSQQL